MSQNGDLIAVGEKQFSPYRVADYLTTPSEITAYLKAAKEANDPELLAAAIEDIRQIELYRGRLRKRKIKHAKPVAEAVAA